MAMTAFQRILEAEKARVVATVQLKRHEEVLKKFREPAGNTFALRKKGEDEVCRRIKCGFGGWKQLYERSENYFASSKVILGPEDLMRGTVKLAEKIPPEHYNNGMLHGGVERHRPRKY